MTQREQGVRRWAAAGLCVLLVALAGCGPSTLAAASAQDAREQRGATALPATVATKTQVSSPTAIVVLPSATPAPSPKPAPPEPTAAATVAPTPTDARFSEAQVIEVVDGDTIKVLVAGEKLTVRYIGIDTPEMGGADGEAAREHERRPGSLGPSSGAATRPPRVWRSSPTKETLGTGCEGSGIGNIMHADAQQPHLEGGMDAF